jgi:hypothetical protein
MMVRKVKIKSRIQATSGMATPTPNCSELNDSYASSLEN